MPLVVRVWLDQTALWKQKRLCFVVNPDPGSEHCWQPAQIYKCMSVKRGRTSRKNLQTPGPSVSLPPLECHNTAHLKGGGQTGGVKLGLQIETLGMGFKIFGTIKLDRRWISSLWQTKLNCSHLEQNKCMNEAFMCENSSSTTSIRIHIPLN